MNSFSLNTTLHHRVAIIDIGSNSIRYMTAGRSDVGLSFSRKEVYTTRLAEGLLATGQLSELRMAQSIETLCMLSARARADALPVFAYATSAVRDAKNRDVFLQDVFEHAALSIRVLSGEEEANFAYWGATSGVGALIDIGGGSTQVMNATFRRSFPLGCVRVKDLCPQMCFTEMRDRMLPLLQQTYVLPSLPVEPWSAVGGTATTLAALYLGQEDYDPAAVSKCLMTSREIDNLLLKLDAMGDDARRRHPLLRDRHDVILCGGVILSFLINHLNIDRVFFRDADGMEGYAAAALTVAPSS